MQRRFRSVTGTPRALAGALLALGLAACSSPEPMPTVASVDRARFIGDWYVQAHIPAGAEEDAFNAVESYALDDDGRILTSYVFREGGFEGELETLEPVGFVRDEATGATWGMRFIWPFQAEYLIVHLDADYRTTIVGRTKRDLAWIMTREPEVDEERLAPLIARLGELGYDVSEVRRVPQRWPDPEHPVTQAGGDLARFTRR
jgi:apolipoprotein D and lipocalin family protein